MIKAIIFDCFGVLQVDASHYFYEHHVTDFIHLRPQLLELHRAYDIGLLSQTELNEQVADITGLSPAFVAENILRVNQRNQPLLDYGQSMRSHYKLGMLSNIGAGGMAHFFTPSEQAALFDVVVLSSDVGMVKPSPEIFLVTAQRLGVGVDECIMVDDNVDNVAGAIAAGMHGVLYQTNQQVQRDIERHLAAADEARR